MNDPFADAPTNDQFNADNEFPKTEEKKTVTVSEKTDGKMTITLKGGSGFDSPWIVLYADDASDGLEQMQDENLKTLMDVVKRAGKHFAGGDSKPAAQPQQGSTPPQQQPPSNVSDDERTCNHGERVFKSGVNKQGKPYKAMFCPSQDRNSQCPPKWLR